MSSFISKWSGLAWPSAYFANLYFLYNCHWNSGVGEFAFRLRVRVRLGLVLTVKSNIHVSFGLGSWCSSPLWFCVQLGLSISIRSHHTWILRLRLLAWLTYQRSCHPSERRRLEAWAEVELGWGKFASCAIIVIIKYVMISFGDVSQSASQLTDCDDICLVAIKVQGCGLGHG